MQKPPLDSRCRRYRAPDPVLTTYDHEHMVT
jgi:hypothetical protein